MSRVLASLDELMAEAADLPAGRAGSAKQKHRAFKEKVESVLESAELLPRKIGKSLITALRGDKATDGTGKTRRLQVFKVLMPAVGYPPSTLERTSTVIQQGKGPGSPFKTRSDAQVAHDDIEPRSLEVLQFVIGLEFASAPKLRARLHKAVQDVVRGYSKENFPARQK